MLVSLVLGLWNGFLIAVLGIQPIIATLVLMLAGRGIALLITEGFITTVNSEPYKFMSQGYVLGFPFAFFVSIAAIVIIAIVERRTALGVLTESVGINPVASRLAGVRSRGIIWGAYVASGVLAGIAGILYSSNIMAADANAAGLYIELYAILAVVLGGTSLTGGKFTIAGTVIGVFTIQTLTSTITFLGVPPAASPVFMASRRDHRRPDPISARASSRAEHRPIAALAQHLPERGGRTMTTKLETIERRTDAAASRYRTFMNRHSSLLPTFAAVIILLVLLVGAQVVFGNFITPRNLSSLLLDNAYLVILAVGMTFVIITGGIDLSVGSVMAFTGILCAKLLADGLPAVVVVPLMILGGAAIGLLIGVLVQYFDVQPFIASLAGLFLARGLAFVVSLSSIKVEDPAILWLQSTRFQLGGWYITPTGIIALLVVAIGVYVMQWTRFGRTIYAIGGSEQSARLMGLPVARTKVLVYVISGVCGGLAGLVLTAYSGAGYPLNGVGTELDTIAAVVIGGTILTGGSGYVLGSLVGVLVYGTITSVISFMGAEQSWTRIIIGALLLLFIVVQRVIVSRADRRR